MLKINTKFCILNTLKQVQYHTQLLTYSPLSLSQTHHFPTQTLTHYSLKLEVNKWLKVCCVRLITDNGHNHSNGSFNQNMTLNKHGFNPVLSSIR
mgnify:CR=1 FL=1